PSGTTPASAIPVSGTITTPVSAGMPASLGTPPSATPASIAAPASTTPESAGTPVSARIPVSLPAVASGCTFEPSDVRLVESHAAVAIANPKTTLRSSPRFMAFGSIAKAQQGQSQYGIEVSHNGASSTV